jgi:glycosyltransferase involved in cell wall biosynthesis
LKKIKILVDAHVLDGKHQGTSSYITGLYSELSKREECDVFIATKKQESVDKYFDKSTNVTWVPLSSKNKYERLAVEFDALAKKIKPDYSHFQYITPLTKSNKWINTIHDVLFLDFPENFPLSYRIQNYCLFKIGALRSDILLTVSEYSKQQISHHFKVSQQDIIVTPNAIDDISAVPAKSIKPLESSKFYLYVSRFEPRKNQHLLIESFLKSNAANDSKLVLVGAPALAYPELEKHLSNIPNNRVMHLQGIEKSELVWLYQHAIASLYPSKGEGFGIPPLEAMALGCASYSAENTALTELSPYLSGTFENNQMAITSLINRITLEDPKKILQEKSEQVISTFNWAASADVLLKKLIQEA